MTLGVGVSRFHASATLGPGKGKNGFNENEVNNATLSVTGDRGDGGME